MLCGKCHGRGVIAVQQHGPFTVIDYCPECFGNGRIACEIGFVDHDGLIQGEQECLEPKKAALV